MQGDPKKTPLSSRLRAGSECAPWVIEEVRKLEAALAASTQEPKGWLVYLHQPDVEFRIYHDQNEAETVAQEHGTEAHPVGLLAPARAPVAASNSASLLTVQEAWVAAGGNPEIKASKQDLLIALRMMDKALDKMDEEPTPAARALRQAVETEHERCVQVCEAVSKELFADGMTWESNGAGSCMSRLREQPPFAKRDAQAEGAAADADSSSMPRVDREGRG